MESTSKPMAVGVPKSNAVRGIIPEFGPNVPIAERRPVAPVIRSLKIGEEAVFPCEQHTSVNTTLCRLRKDYRRQGWDAIVTENKDFTVTVTRVS